MKVHPVQLNYTRFDGVQKCGLCNATEEWKTGVRNSETLENLSEVQQWNSLHLVHLTKEHLSDVQASLTRAGRAEEITISETEVRKRVHAQ